MKSKSLKRTSFVVTLTIALGLVGYEFMISLLSPIASGEAGTQIVTIPYRAVVFGLTLYSLLLTRNIRTKPTVGIWCLAAYWLILIVRLISDVCFRPEFHFGTGEVNKMMLYVFCIDIPLILLSVRGFRIIDFRLLYRLCFWMLLLAGAFALIFNGDAFVEKHLPGSTYRVQISGLNPILLGHLGAGLIILALFYSQMYGKTFKSRLIKWIAYALGLYIVIKAASRGPFMILCFILILNLYYNRKKYGIITFCLFVLALAVWPLLQEYVLTNVLQNIAPDLYDRLSETLDKGDIGRAKLLRDSTTIIENNILIGNQFCIYEEGRFYYAHNILYDALIAGGIFGLGLILVPIINSFVAIHALMKTRARFFALFALKFILTNFMSGSVFSSPPLNECFILLILLLAQQRYHINKSIVSPNWIYDKKVAP